MADRGSVLALLFVFAAAPGAAVAQAPPPAAPADTARPPVRVVRRFPPTEVWATLHDLRSSETVRMIPGSTMRVLPIDNLTDAIALQAGVVAQGEELHVRGGRNGETAVTLDGLSLNEPLRRRPLDVPLLALRSADLVSGAPEAQYGSGLAGTIDMRSAEPGERFSGECRWQTALEDRWFDRASARVGGPLHLLGLGVLAAGDATLDDTWLPHLRSDAGMKVAGIPFVWRAENRMLGYVKLAPIDQSRRFVAQVLVNRQLHRPYDPSWSLDGWVIVDPLFTGRPTFSQDSLPGSVRYRAADHLAVTDDRQFAALVSASTMGARRHGTLSLGWLRTRTVTSVSGRRGAGYIGADETIYGDPRGLAGPPGDPFLVIWGDYPLYRESGSDVYTLRGDGEVTTPSGGTIKAGAGTTLEHVTLRELDGTLINRQLDSLRAYDASAPGLFAYVQGRWSLMGMVANMGLRAEYFTAGSEAGHQTLPGSARGLWSLSPRLGLTYPVSVRDAFSLAYVRVQQAPGRDFLYDQRRLISNRQPLGNPALLPATVVSYEASVKHLFSLAWAAQTSVFFRNVCGQVGARNYYFRPNVAVPYYTNDDEASALGFEWSLLHTSNAARRLELHYTWMQAWGSESRPEGDPYGPVRAIARAADRGRAALVGPPPLDPGELRVSDPGTLVRVVVHGSGLAAALDAQDAARAAHGHPVGQQQALPVDGDHEPGRALVAAPGARSHGRARGAQSVRPPGRARTPRWTATRIPSSTRCTTTTAPTGPRPATGVAPTARRSERRTGALGAGPRPAALLSSPHRAGQHGLRW